MQITSGSGNYGPYTDPDDSRFLPAGGLKSDNTLPLNSFSSRPNALSFDNVTASDRPTPINFGATPAHAVNNRNTGTNNASNDQNNDAVQNVLQLLQQIIQALIQQLFSNMFGMNNNPPSEDQNSAPLVSSGGGGGSSVPQVNIKQNADMPVSGDTARMTKSSAENINDFSGQDSTGLPGLPDKLKPFSKDYTDAAKETGIPASTLAALTWTESRGDVNASSTNPGNGKTDGGLNQINPDTYESVRQKYPDKLSADASDPHNQILCSALLLRDYKQQFGSVDAALRAYNSGPGQVNPDDLSKVTLGNPNYVNEVTSTAKVIASGQGSVPA